MPPAAFQLRLRAYRRWFGCPVVCTGPDADPHQLAPWVHGAKGQFNALLEQYESHLNPHNTHQEFLVSQMAAAPWKLNRIETLENEMFAGLDDPANAFTNQETPKGFARLERYRASLERTYHRCARELQCHAKRTIRTQIHGRR